MVYGVGAVKLTADEKAEIKRSLADCLSADPEVQRVVVFGSFLTSPDPHDVDVAVFQSSQERYLPLALRYRRRVRPVAKTIPVDVIPVRAQPVPGPMTAEIERGEVIYER
jgi:predicted nucleotidyltransferase